MSVIKAPLETRECSDFMVMQLWCQIANYITCLVPRKEGKKFGRELVRKGKKNEVKKSCLVGIKIISYCQ